MPADDLAQVIEDYHRSMDALVRGDPAPTKRLWSRGDDITLANPIGPPVRGWPAVEQTLERAASLLREGESKRFERISEYATADLAYIVEIERNRSKVGGAAEITPISLRVTTIFRRERDGWRIVHRHADAITTPRPVASVVSA